MRKNQRSCFLDHYWLFGGLCLMLAVLIGCTVTQLGDAESESTISEISLVPIATATTVSPVVAQTSSATASPVIIISPSAAPTKTPTTTILPSATSTAHSTSVPALTPLPTIPSEERGHRYVELMNNNGGCKLPCWWGFDLGNTYIDEIRQFYTTFNAYITERNGSNGISVLEVLFVDPEIEGGEQTRHSFVTQNSIVFEAEIQLKNQPNYQIERMLTDLGQPADIWMWTIPEPREGILPTRFQLYFPETGVLAIYATNGILNDDTVTGCFNTPGNVTIHIWDPSSWDPNGDKGIEERASQVGSAFRLDSYHPIEEVSNWDVEQFYSVLSDPAHSECLETLSSLWPSP